MHGPIFDPEIRVRDRGARSGARENADVGRGNRMTESNWLASAASGGEVNSGRQIGVTLLTADRCEGQFTVTQAVDGNLVSSRIVWSPHEPDKETESVVVTIGKGGHEEGHVIDGDVWRDLESQELDDELWARLLSGKGLDDVLASMPIRAAGPRL